jgi:hypothetical protein
MWLMIENDGEAPPEAFTLMGASTKRGSDQIGQFGTGTKLGLCALLRAGAEPVIVTSEYEMTFSLRIVHLGETAFRQVFYNCRGEIKPTGFVVENGALDWDNPALGLREFVSNAIDAGGMRMSHETKIKAAPGKTRIYIPRLDFVDKFYRERNHWFLSYTQPLMPKKKPGGAQIYRRGVFVREVATFMSVYDYNLDGLQINECRQADDWSVEMEATRVLMNSDPSCMAVVLQTSDSWERRFRRYCLIQTGEWWNKVLEILTSTKQSAFCNTNQEARRLALHGFQGVVVSEEYMAALPPEARSYKTMVNEGEIFEYTTLDVVPDKVQHAFDMVWLFLKESHMTREKEKPELKCFVENNAVKGLFRKGVVYIAHVDDDIDLRRTALEELGHYITGAADGDRELQEFLLHCAIPRYK